MLSLSTIIPTLLLAAEDVSVTRGTAGEWRTLIGLGLLLFLGLIVFAYTTKAGIIARATTKEAVRQPIFSLVLAFQNFGSVSVWQHVKSDEKLI